MTTGEGCGMDDQEAARGLGGSSPPFPPPKVPLLPRQQVSYRDDRKKGKSNAERRSWGVSEVWICPLQRDSRLGITKQDPDRGIALAKGGVGMSPCGPLGRSATGGGHFGAT